MARRQRGRPKNAGQLRRRAPIRETYEKVLIVCEGAKTEPNYFLDLRDHYDLNTANVAVTGECGSDPISIVRFAKELFKKEAKTGDPFDRVYCVFDKDTHAKYADALRAIAEAKPKKKFFAINSVPCFEYWLLLHFRFTTAPYSPSGRKSAAQIALEHLKQELPNYEKGTSGLFVQLLDRLTAAIEHAERACQIASENDTDNPSTLVHELVTFLQGIKG